MKTRNVSCGKNKENKNKIKKMRNKKATRALSSNYYSKILNSKRSQFKIQQMMFMLLAVTIFFALVVMFWLAFSSSNLRSQAEELEKEKAIFVSQFLSGSSEFSCTSKGGGYCIDTDKIINLQNRKAYEEFWPVAFVKVRKLDRKNEDVVCNKANYPDCNVYKVYENNKIEYEGVGIGSFVALCRYEDVLGYPTRMCDIGKIIIGYNLR